MHSLGWWIGIEQHIDEICPQRQAGRWHYAGGAVVYCSRSPELAMLEARVHHQRGTQGYRLQQWCCAKPVSVECIAVDALAHDWVRRPARTRALGRAWLESQRVACLQVPSSVCPEAHNLLINPALVSGLYLRSQRPFRFDRRLILLRD